MVSRQLPHHILRAATLLTPGVENTIRTRGIVGGRLSRPSAATVNRPDLVPRVADRHYSLREPASEFSHVRCADPSIIHDAEILARGPGILNNLYLFSGDADGITGTRTV